MTSGYNQQRVCVERYLKFVDYYICMLYISPPPIVNAICNNGSYLNGLHKNIKKLFDCHDHFNNQNV